MMVRLVSYKLGCNILEPISYLLWLFSQFRITVFLALLPIQEITFTTGIFPIVDDKCFFVEAGA